MTDSSQEILISDVLKCLNCALLLTLCGMLWNTFGSPHIRILHALCTVISGLGHVTRDRVERKTEFNALCNINIWYSEVIVEWWGTKVSGCGWLSPLMCLGILLSLLPSWVMSQVIPARLWASLHCICVFPHRNGFVLYSLDMYCFIIIFKF